MTTTQHDLVILGAGPGGYVAAIRAAQLGLDVAIVDEHAALGGTCLRIGCIPSKALLESSERFRHARDELATHGVQVIPELDLPTMHARKERVVKTLTGGVKSLMKKNGVTVHRGRGRLADATTIVLDGDAHSRVEGRRLVIATGSRPAPLRGVELDHGRIGSSTEALAYPEVPERLVVIGAGVIGLELGSVWRRLGAEVVVLEYLDRILPGVDGEIAREAQKLLTKQGLDFRLGSRVTAARREGDRCVVEAEGAEPTSCDRVLLSVGRSPVTDELGLEEVGVTLDERGFVTVDDSYRTSVETIFAIGDVIGGALLAHKASEEGIACVERMVTGYGHVNYDAIPSVVYTEPEVATVGKTEEELRELGVEYRAGKFPFRATGRARSLGHIDGLVKILADAATDRVLGVHVVGPQAGELIAEAVTAIELGASSEDIARTSHAHPTLAEALKEAALAVDGRALHI